MQNRLILLLGAALALLVTGCEKQNAKEPSDPVYDDASFLLGGLVKEVDGEYIPMWGFLSDEGLVIPVTSADEAETHFRSLLSPTADLRTEGGDLVWNLTDEQGASQGKAVFRKGSGAALAQIDLPGSFPEVLRAVLYKPSTGLLMDVNPDVREELEDYYYYGAIVDIADHGCGSGKFVVLREYNFDTGANGMAIRLDKKLYDLDKLDYNTEIAIWKRSSCRSTMKTARAILHQDWNILSVQLKKAGSNDPANHYASNDRNWRGLHYYVNMWDDDEDTIGSFFDLEFYECWIYWFHPSGNTINFW